MTEEVKNAIDVLTKNGLIKSMKKEIKEPEFLFIRNCDGRFYLSTESDRSWATLEMFCGKKFKMAMVRIDSLDFVPYEIVKEKYRETITQARISYYGKKCMSKSEEI